MRTNRQPIKGEVLQEARVRRGLTQEDVQRACAAQGQPVWNLSRWENGQIKWPRPATLLAVLEVLELTHEEVFGRKAA